MNERKLKLGRERSSIRELFEYGKQRAREIGAENVFDFSIGNPSAPAPDCVREEIVRLLNEMPSAELHGYTSAQGDPAVREAAEAPGVPRRGHAESGQHSAHVCVCSGLLGHRRAGPVQPVQVYGESHGVHLSAHRPENHVFRHG